MLTKLIPCLAIAGALCAQSLSIRLPERTRLLEDQRVDLVVEVRNAAANGTIKVTANGTDISGMFRGPAQVDLDCDGKQDIVYRSNLYGFQATGSVKLVAGLSTDKGQMQDSRDITVYPFKIQGSHGKNVILYIGDAMGTAYRDAARIISRSVETSPGVPGLRGGYFDNLLEMDKMPVSGMSMTYATDRVVPDSANTASTWSTGNKTFYNALGVFADGTDCVWRGAGRSATTFWAMSDNPRVETLWEYLKRKYNYRAGIVTTADVTDATPAGEAAHVAHRDARYEVANQFIANPFLDGKPVFDVILGGGMEEFEGATRADRRDLINEFQQLGYRYVQTASALQTVSASDSQVLGLFRRGNKAAAASTGIRATPDGNMEVAYDKLKLRRPASEPEVNFNGFEDQPFLDLMTRKAIEVLSGSGGDRPFILMVEGASIDKQSHPNHAAGTNWDTIELDKAVGVGRAWAHARKQSDTLLVVTADHDQSMHIIGVTDASDSDIYDRSSTYTLNLTTPVGAQSAKVFKDANTNVRAAYNYANSGGDPNSGGKEGPPAMAYGNIADTEGLPDYIDANGDGYPENQQVGAKGKKRLSVGFRTGNHTGSSVPVTAEGPGAILFTGYQDQSDLMFKMAVGASGITSEWDNLLDKVLQNDKYPKTFGK